MKIEINELQKAIKLAKKYGISGKTAIIKISKEGSKSVATIYNDKAELRTILHASWENTEKDWYKAHVDQLPTIDGEIEFTKDTVKLSNGTFKADYTYPDYSRLQREPQGTFITNKVATAKTNEYIDLFIEDKEPLKTMISLADNKNYIVIDHNYISFSPNSRVGGFTYETKKHNTDVPICLTKNGAKFLTGAKCIPRKVQVFNSSIQLGTQIYADNFLYTETLREFREPGKDLYESGGTIKIAEVVCGMSRSMKVGDNATIRLPDELVSLLTTLKFKDKKTELSVSGQRGFKSISVQVGDLKYTADLKEELNYTLDMCLTHNLALPYLKALKKYGGTISYNHTQYQAKFTYDNIPLSGCLLGVKKRGI